MRTRYTLLIGRPPFQKGVAEGKLFTADYSAGLLLAVLSNLTPDDSGGVFAWDGVRVPE